MSRLGEYFSAQTLPRAILASLFVLALVGIFGYAAYQAFDRLSYKGVVCEILGFAALCFLAQKFRSQGQAEATNVSDVGGTDGKTRDKKPEVNAAFFWTATALFLICFPFSVFFHAVGVVPGLIFIFLFSYFWGALRAEYSLHGVVGLLFLAIFFWLWGEAGRPGLVVMPVDIPEGREDLSFTADGVANALESELEFFGVNNRSSTYADSEASKILARELSSRLFPRSPWYKGSDARPPGLVGLQASHVVVGTNVEGFPLSSIYHILRHIRDMPLLEAQVLIGEDGSLTLALRRSNAPLHCDSDGVPDAILDSSSNGTGQRAINELWKATKSERRDWPHIPDDMGCAVGPLRRVLSWLDIIPLPSGGEERIANVTVHRLKGDVQLTAALQLAALQAMPSLSPERMALFYDNSGKYASALSFEKKSLTDLLREAHDDPPYLQAFARQRLANAFIRIGDFEGQLQSNWKASDHAYDLAAKVSPRDVNVLARIGYGYLIRANELDWKDQQCQSQSNSCKSTRDKALSCSVQYLKEAVAHGERGVLSKKRFDQVLAWAEANLAYALVLASPKQNHEEAVKWSGEARKMQATDIRQKIVSEYVMLMDPSYSASATPGPLFCADSVSTLREIDPMPGDPDSLGIPQVALTLHNNLLIEQQLAGIYERLISICPSQIKDRVNRATEHKFLFDSLLALNYIQNGSPHPERPVEDFYRTVKSQISGSTQSKKRRDGDSGTSERLLEIVLRHAFITRNPRFEDAKNLCDFERTATEDSVRGSSFCAKTRAVVCSGKLDELEKEARTAAEAFPDDAFLRANESVVLLKMNQKRLALATQERSVRLNPNDPSLRYLFALALNASGKPEEAVEQLTYGRSLDPEGWRGVTQNYESISLSPCPSTYEKSALLDEYEDLNESGAAISGTPSRHHVTSNKKR